MNAPDQNREVALTFVRAGLHVFPCDATTKRPLVAEWPTRAADSEAGARYYWSTRPGAMVGLNLAPVGLLVFDFDRGHADGVDGCSNFDELLDETGEEFPFDRTPTVWTPSTGAHVYTKQPMGRDPLGNSNRNLPPGIDVRGNGGYVIAPGSVRSDGTHYEAAPGSPDLIESYVNGTIPEVPAWLVAGIEWRDDSAPSSSVPVFTDADADRLRKWALGALNRKASELTGVQKGGRNHALNRAVFVIAGKAWCGLSEDEVYRAMVWACTINKLIADDGIDAFNATFRSGWDAGILKPLPGPRERLADGGVKIQLTSKLRQKDEVG